MLDAGEISFSKNFFASPRGGLSIFKDCGGCIEEISPSFPQDCSNSSFTTCLHAYIFICACQCCSNAFLIEICYINKKKKKEEEKEKKIQQHKESTTKGLEHFFLCLANSVNQVLSGTSWQITCL